MREFYNYIQITIFIIFTISIFYFFNFIVDDAFIVYRYAENFINIGALVFNEGEPVNALTSPLHALIMSLAFYLTSSTIIVNKLLSIVLLLTSAFLVYKQFKKQIALQTLALILILLPSHVLLWTLGGLETIFLLFLVTITTLLVVNGVKHEFSLKSLCLIFFLAGLGFLTRYDSIIFFLPVVLYAATKSRQIKFIPVAMLVGGLLPIIWLLISVNYYGDLLPTSFYVKTPKILSHIISRNSEYVFINLFYIGVLPTIAVMLILLLGHKKTPQHFQTMWWLYLAIILVILYGFTMATTHMMFSLRFFVPYIAVTTFLLLSFIQNPAINDHHYITIFYKFFLLILLLFNSYQIYFTYNYSINGISYLGGYRQLSMQKYFELINTWKQEAKNIKTHWQSIKKNKNHKPHIATYAEGVVPYYFRDTYIYGPLVSYRHGATKTWGKWARSSDYMHGFPKKQYSDIKSNWPIISKIEGPFLRNIYHIFLVFYNDNAFPNTLGATINEPNIK